MRDVKAAAELQRLLELTPYAREEFNFSYEQSTSEIDRAHKTIIRSFMGFGTDSVTRSCRTGFQAKLSDNRVFPAQAWQNYAAAVPTFTSRLMSVLIEQRDAVDVMRRLDSPSTLFYLDPPYPLGTRSSLAGRSKSTHGYRHELTDCQHVELLGVVKTLKGMVVLSSYGSDLYDDSLADWQRSERKALADGARERTEVLWVNGACSIALGALGPETFTKHNMPLFTAGDAA